MCPVIDLKGFQDNEPVGKKIIHLAINKISQRLAVLRGDSIIEVYDISKNRLEMILPNPKNCNIHAISWFNDKLYAGGFDGYLIEYTIGFNFFSAKILFKYEPIWCIVTQYYKLMFSTENGKIYIFNVPKNEDEDYVLCDTISFMDRIIHFDVNGDYIVASGVENIFVIQGTTIINNFSLKSRNNDPCIVWCCKFVDDITIVTGTSDGFTTFWDIKLGFIKEFSSHKYDVRTISVLKDTVISTGVDAKLVHFKKITNENGFEWIQTFESRRQLFDIFHSIGITDTSVLVAGNGGMVNFVDKESNKIKSVITSIDRFFKVKSVKFTKKGHFVVQTNSKTLELWTLVDKDVSMCVKVDSEIIILNFSVNSTGSLIIYSTIDGMYLISISNTKKQINKSYQIVSNLKFPCFQENCFEYFINFEFLSDNIINENLVAVTLQNDFIIYNAVDSFQIVAKWKLEEQIVNIFVSKFQSIVALLSLTNTVYILSYSTVDKQNMNLKIISKNLFKNDINDLIFHLMDSLVLLEFCNNMIVEFDYKRRKYTKFTQKLLKKYPKTLRKTSTTNFNINYKNHLMYGENSNQILYICGNDEFTFDWEKDELNIVKKHLKFGYYGYINNGTSKVYAITRNRQNMFKSCPEIVYFKKYAQ